MPQATVTDFVRPLAVLLACALGLTLLQTTFARAATIEAGDGEPCAIHIRGIIEEGDFEKLEIANDAFYDKVGSGEINDETRQKLREGGRVICLDSEGGHLIEGTKIAREIRFDREPTYIADGSVCYSICAIIFMMGNMEYPGPTPPERRFQYHRTLHVGGDLAFHSPSLKIQPNQRYSSEAIEKAYAFGIESMLEVVRTAAMLRPFKTRPMIHPELVEKLLSTPGDDLFHIKTMEQVLNWEINLDGLPPLYPQRNVQLQMGCENSLVHGYLLPSERGYGFYTPSMMTKDVFGFERILGAGRLFGTGPPFDNGATEIFSFRYLALPVECQVKLYPDRVEICGEDPHLSTPIGDCATGEFEAFPPETRFHPLTEFAALREVPVAADVIRKARCTLLAPSGGVLRDETCTQSVDLVEHPTRPHFRHTLRWTSGAETVIEVKIDNSSETSSADAYTVDKVPALPEGDGDPCLRRLSDGHVVCVGDL